MWAGGPHIMILAKRLRKISLPVYLGSPYISLFIFPSLSQIDVVLNMGITICRTLARVHVSDGPLWGSIHVEFHPTTLSVYADFWIFKCKPSLLLRNILLSPLHRMGWSL